MSRVFDLALDTPWAITEESLCLLLEIAGRKLDADLELPGTYEPESVAVQTGSELEGARRVTVRDNVAIVPVLGPIFRYANIFTEISGATSVELLARDFNAALKNPDVEAILLDVDSPGGQVNGISEMSDLIVGARGGDLPIHAFISGSGASAAYWLASSADEVVVADTALVGSIGVRAAFVDRSEQDRQRGIKRIEFVSSQSPQKVPDPTEEDGREQIQARVDELADVFINAIARNRGVTRGQVLEDFGQGRVFVGEDAVSAGLVDGVGTFERTLARLQEKTVTARSRRGIAALTEERPMADADEGQQTIEDMEMSAEQLREAFPDAVADIELAASEESALAERERILAIRDLEAPGHEQLKADAMENPEATAESVSRAIVEATAEKRRAQLEASKQDEEELEAPDARAGADELEGPEQAAAFILTAGKRPAEASA